MERIEEDRRVAALHELNLLDTDPEDGFDSITKLAVTLTGASMAAISLVDRDRQWFKSSVGVDVSEMPRDITFCNHAIRQASTLYVPDARLDERFKHNPLVAGEPHLRGYAGVPLQVESGYRIGTLSVFHDQPFAFDAMVLQQLAVLARVVEEQIRTRSQSAEARRANQLLAGIAAIQREYMTDASSIDQAFDHLLAAALEFTDSTAGFIGEIVEDESGRYLKTQAFSHVGADDDAGDERRASLEFRDPDTLIGHTIKTGEMVIANDPAQDQRGRNAVEALSPLHAYLGIPLLEKGKLVAMIGIANRPSGYCADLVAACEPLFVTAGNLIRARRTEVARDSALAELALSKGRYDLAIAGSASGIWEIDFAAGTMFASERSRELVGRSPGDPIAGGKAHLQGMSEFFGRVHENDRERVQTALRAHLQHRTPYALEYDFQHSDGHYLRVFACGQAEWDEAGQATRMAGSIEDITERSHLIAERESTAARLAEVTKLGGIGSWEVNLDADTVLWDSMTRKIHEVDDDYVPDLASAVEFYPPEAREALQANIDRAIKLGEAWDLELPFVTARGNHAWVRAVGRAIAVDGHVGKLVGSFQDITGRRAREEEAKSLSTRLAVALDASNLGVWEYDIQTRINTGDERMMTLLGLSGEVSLTFDDWAAAIHPDDREAIIAGTRTAMEVGAGFSHAYRIVRPDGSIRHVRSRGLLCERLDGSATVIGVTDDVTDDVGRAEELDHQRARAESASQAKSQFLTNMSHEIRTPLNGVLGMSQLLRLTPLSDQQDRYVRTLQTSGEALLDLVEDILDISKIESGTIQLAREPFEVLPVVASVMDMVETAARRKAITICCEQAPGLPGVVLGDQKRLRQVLINIIGNAVKFTSEGSVTIQVEPQADDRIRFCIADTGPGIAADQLERVFDRFAQVDASLTRQHGGSGLGLAICRDLVRLAGGEIGVRSEPGEGAEFWFELPLPPAEASVVAPVSPPAELPRPGGRRTGPARILVVDDVMTNRLVASALVENAGHQVRLAGNGREAIDALDSDRFDAILMDIQMPVMSGDEAIQCIRASGKPYSTIPIYAVTADATKGAREHYLEIGATGYLSKPLDIKEISAALDEVLRGAMH
ncbi:PAS domain-containing protein [Maricaulis salignorans]|uniref:histidine kinase n=1 Tax=Maricaulis salignorans TaxID=144026 RepID=A0A1G9RK81_9PROT|nr:PAS domain-containing protein [Maricaulis salignorans]SDM22815.1 PAS domain S-box-containing protein [Maricaulis salignorans]